MSIRGCGPTLLILVLTIAISAAAQRSWSATEAESVAGQAQASEARSTGEAGSGTVADDGRDAAVRSSQPSGAAAPATQQEAGNGTTAAARERDASSEDPPTEAAPRSDGDATPLVWLSDYRRAWDRAAANHKMLLISFHSQHPRGVEWEVDQAFRQDAAIRKRASDFVLLRLPVNATIHSNGAPVRLIEHAAFSQMHGHAGLAIIELVDKARRETYGRVVSAFPFAPGKYYRFHVAYLPVILNLPLGTITQRTMIWAVRTHPERPTSTLGKEDPTLAAAACRHCRYQARLGVQGHHQWGMRFQRLRRLLGWRYTPVEVVAESWPGQDLLDSCVDCVASWRHSSGHWRQVSSRHARYAYDIHQGSNGIWYGTGLFAN